MTPVPFNLEGKQREWDVKRGERIIFKSTLTRTHTHQGHTNYHTENKEFTMHINHLRFYYNKHQKLHEYSMTAHYNHLQHVIKSAKSIRIILMLRFKMSYILSHCMVLFRFVLPFYLFPRPPVFFSTAKWPLIASSISLFWINAY